MATAYYWRLYCNTESSYVYTTTWESPTAPAQCPNNSERSIDSSATTLLKLAGGSPQTTDGKDIVLPNLFPGGVFLYLCGAGDDTSSGRGAGTEFKATRSTEGTTDTEFYFNDWVYLAGGGALFNGAEYGDNISFQIYCPATSVTENGTNEGNCNLTPVGGGINIITPAAGDGTHDVNLENANPVPSATDEEDSGTGYYTWSKPDTGLGTVSVGSPGASEYNLFDSAVIIAKFIHKVPLMGNGLKDLTLPAIKPKRILPHWRFKISIYCSSAHTLEVMWHITMGRTTTY